MIRRSLLALASGLLTALAYEPLAWWPLLLVGITGLVLMTYGVTWRRALLLGALYGSGFMGVHQLWMRSVGWDAWALIAGLELAFFVPMAAGWAVVMRLPGWPVWVTAWWVAVEQWRTSWPFGGMPWGRVAYATADSPFASALPYLGSVGVGALVVLVCAVLAYAVLHRRAQPSPPARQLLLVGGALVAAVLLPVLMPWTGQVEGTSRVAVVQGDVPGDGTNILFDHMQVSRNHIDETLRLAEQVDAGREPRPDFVVWPENSTAVDPFRNTELDAGIARVVRALDAPLLVGAIVDSPRKNQVLNQGIVWRPELGAGERYTKRHPVPFGEYIPWREVNPLTSRFERFAMISRDMAAGTRLDPLPIAGTLVADSICFDIAYDDGIFAQVRRGAQMLVVQTSNATYIKTEQTDQQFAITRVRAMETGRWAVVAATNGVAGIIGPDGSVAARLPKRTPGHASHEVTLTSAVPPSIALAPVISWLAVATAIGSWLYAVTARRRLRHGRRGWPGRQDVPVTTRELAAR